MFISTEYAAPAVSAARRPVSSLPILASSAPGYLTYAAYAAGSDGPDCVLELAVDVSELLDNVFPPRLVSHALHALQPRVLLEAGQCQRTGQARADYPALDDADVNRVAAWCQQYAAQADAVPAASTRGSYALTNCYAALDELLRDALGETLPAELPTLTPAPITTRPRPVRAKRALTAHGPSPLGVLAA